MMSKQPFSVGDAVVSCLGACLGVAAYIVPALLMHPDRHYNAALFPLLRAGVEQYSRFTAAALLFSGAVLGLIRPGRPWLRGFSTIALLPIVSFLEMGMDPTSHNLFPLEFMCYAVEALPAVLGAYLASRVRTTCSRRGG